VAQGSHRETRGWIESFEMERRVWTSSSRLSYLHHGKAGDACWSLPSHW